MCFECCFPKKRTSSGALREPLVTEDGRPSRMIRFNLLHIADIDKIFNDFQRVFNSFVENRIALEMAENSLKDAIRSFQEFHPKSTLENYVKALKTKLAGEGIVIKIKKGVATFSGEIEKVDHAAEKAKEAIEQILEASERIFNMAPNIIHSSEDSILRIESLNATSIIKNECSSPKHAIQTGKMLKDNCKMMKNVPKIVKDFTDELEKIITELLNAFGEKQEVKSKDPSKDTRNGNKKEVRKDKHDPERDGKEKKDEHGTEKNGKEKKDDYEKALKMEHIGVPDIDSLFQDFASALNPFVTSREKMQKARKSFEAAMNMLISFDADKELQEYLKELKKKAAMEEIHLYIDLNDGDVYIRCTEAVAVPKPYIDAVKCINDIKSCGVQLLGMEPQIDRGVQSCLDDLSKIDPMADIRREMNFTAFLTIGRKVKKFNNNLKKARKSPKIIKDFFSYVRKTLSDIKEFFDEESK